MIAADISSLRGAEQGTSVAFEFSEPTPGLEDLPRLRNLTGGGAAAQLGDRVLAKGEFRATLTLDCARCLKPFEFALQESFGEEFAAEPNEDQFPTDGKQLDLAPMLRTAILTRLPEQPIHDPACKGLCPNCGKDLNEEPHTHPDERPPGPFDALDKLKD